MKAQGISAKKHRLFGEYETLSNVGKSAKKNISSYLFMLPMLIFFLLFLMLPAIQAIYLGFFQFTVSSQKTFVGLENFVALFRDKAFHSALINTFKLMIGIVPLSLIFSLFVAAVLSECKRVIKAFVRGAFYLPVVVSSVTLALVWKFIYDPVIGIANYLLSLLGIDRIVWLGDSKIAMIAVMIVIFSYNLGRPIILYMAAMAGIPPDYYEAAKLDGAKKLQQFIHITLPLLKPTTLYLLVQGTISVFQTFVIIKLLTMGGPNNSTQTLAYLLYEKAFVSGNYGAACAIGAILFVIVSGIAIIQYRWLSDDIEY